MQSKDILKKTFGFLNGKKENKSTPHLKLKIKNDRLTVLLGQWLDLFPTVFEEDNYFSISYDSVLIDELLETLKIKRKDLSIVRKRFSELLLSIGFSTDEEYVLDDFNEDDYSFKCYYVNSKSSVNMKVNFGTWREEAPQLTIESSNVISTYDLYTGNKEEKDALHLSSYSLSVDDKKTFNYNHSPYKFICSLYNDTYRVDIEIDYPEMVNVDSVNYYINVSKIDDGITKLEFPTQILDICRCIWEASLVDLKGYPRIKISSKAQFDDSLKNTEDYIEFKYGKITKYRVSKDDKVIEIDDFENWSYTSSEFSVARDSEKGISFGIRNIPVDKLETINSPSSYVALANNEVESAKKLVLTLLSDGQNE